MTIAISKKISTNKAKIRYYFEFGKEKGQRLTTGLFTYSKPKNQLEKNHNKEALAILQNKHAQLILEYQASGTSYVPTHKLKTNFLDFYDDFVKKNSTQGNRLTCLVLKWRCDALQHSVQVITFIVTIDIFKNSVLF